jgi:hypothetical protein
VPLMLVKMAKIEALDPAVTVSMTGFTKVDGRLKRSGRTMGVIAPTFGRFRMMSTRCKS